MPFLDVTPLLLDPELADLFIVKRRQETVDRRGRSQKGDLVFTDVVGVITALSPSDLDRQADYQTMARRIVVVTKFMLRGESTGYQPDVVVWKGSTYVVKALDLYPHFGEGFIQAECESMDKTDPAVTTDIAPQLAFDRAVNSNFIPLIG